jgi:hypothetical protein
MSIFDQNVRRLTVPVFCRWIDGRTAANNSENGPL